MFYPKNGPTGVLCAPSQAEWTRAFALLVLLGTPQLWGHPHHCFSSLQAVGLLLRCLNAGGMGEREGVRLFFCVFVAKLGARGFPSRGTRERLLLVVLLEGPGSPPTLPLGFLISSIEGKRPRGVFIALDGDLGVSGALT